MYLAAVCHLAAVTQLCIAGAMAQVADLEARLQAATSTVDKLQQGMVELRASKDSELGEAQGAKAAAERLAEERAAAVAAAQEKVCAQVCSS